MRYEHAYKSLCQEVDALVSRNQLVEKEAEHLSQFNAEILGHTNPHQKIHYLDRVRKDLADAKQVGPALCTMNGLPTEFCTETCSINQAARHRTRR